MKIMKLDEIKIPKERQRQHFDTEALLDLMKSIETLGLLHPLVVRNGDTLVAGERRYRVLTDIAAFGGGVRFNNAMLEVGCVPVVNLGELSPLEAEEAELEENIRRVDLSWQEKAETMAKLHSLRTKQAETIGQTHTVRDTAQEVYGKAEGSFGDNARKNLIVAQYLSVPEVAKAKTMDEAFKILKRQEETAKNVALGVRVGKTFSASQHRLYNEDCVEWMRKQAASQFDVILTDPPYGINADKFGNAAGKMSGITHKYDDSYETWQSLMTNLVHESFRLAKPQAHLYIFCDLDRFHELHAEATEAGWWVHRTPIIRTYSDGARVPWPEHGPRRGWEIILYAVKGKRPTLGIYPDFIHTQLTEETYGHGAQKPVGLYRALLDRSCRPGDRVLDPFAGTGTIFPAAHGTKVSAVGVEVSEEYYGIAAKRLGELV